MTRTFYHRKTVPLFFYVRWLKHPALWFAILWAITDLGLAQSASAPATFEGKVRTPPLLAPLPIPAERGPLSHELDQLTAEAVASPKAFLANPAKAERLQALRAQLYPPQPLPRLEFIQEIEIFSDATAIEEEFLILRAEAWNSFVALQNHSPVASSALRAEAPDTESARATNTRLAELAKILAAQDATPPPLPEKIEIPPTATPALRAYLTEQNALLDALRAHPALLSAAPSPSLRPQLESLQQRARELSAESQPATNLLRP